MAAGVKTKNEGAGEKMKKGVRKKQWENQAGCSLEHCYKCYMVCGYAEMNHTQHGESTNNNNNGTPFPGSTTRYHDSTTPPINQRFFPGFNNNYKKYKN